MKTVIKKTRRYVCMEIFRNFMTGLDILMYSSLIWLLYSLAVIKTIHGLEMTGLLWWRQFDGLSISHAPPSVPWALTQRAQERKIRVSVQTEMARRCVLGCGSPETLFPIPKVPWLRSRWLGFLHFEEGGISERSRLCSRHFTRECFKNWTQHEMGFHRNCFSFKWWNHKIKKTCSCYMSYICVHICSGHHTGFKERINRT